MSVPSPSDVQATYCATLVDEWIALGLRDAVICPGSRSTPLAIELARRSEIRSVVRLDERGAAFYALGRTLASSRPTLIVVTSGTAAAELHAAVAEADQAHVPLIVVTADRPSELHGVGAPQTMPQTNLFGPMVRRSVEPGVAQWEGRDSWRPLARDLWSAALGANERRGPVHLNAAFIEPLVGNAQTVTPRAEETPTPRAEVPVTLTLEGERVLAVVGLGTPIEVIEILQRAGVVVIGDATARHSMAYADGLLRHQAFADFVRPDRVIRIGGVVASKTVAQRLREWDLRVDGLDFGFPVGDPDRVVTSTQQGTSLHVEGSADREYSSWWQKVVARAEENFRGLSFASGLLTEATIARTVVEVANETHQPLVIGSSMPFREVEWFAPARVAPTFANRGVNGIDGVVSTLFGVAGEGAALGLVGDLTFLHDSSALVDPPSGPVALVVVANDGGHIFDFLPQSAQLDAETFSLLFTTPRPVSPARVAEGFGHAARRVTTVGELRDALREVARSGEFCVIEAVPSAPTTNVDFHAWLERSLARVANEFLT